MQKNGRANSECCNRRDRYCACDVEIVTICPECEGGSRRNISTLGPSDLLSKCIKYAAELRRGILDETCYAAGRTRQIVIISLFECTARPLRERDGTIVGVIGYALDTTERRRLAALTTTPPSKRDGSRDCSSSRPTSTG